MKILRFSALSAFLALFAGCTSLHTRSVVSLADFKHIYVEHRLTDDHHIDEMFVHELQQLGRDASCGPLTLLPDNADAVLTYADRWEWDFRTYLIELTVELRTARTDKKLADGSYLQQTPKAKPAAEVVHELVASLFKAK